MELDGLNRGSAFMPMLLLKLFQLVVMVLTARYKRQRTIKLPPINDGLGIYVISTRMGSYKAILRACAILQLKSPKPLAVSVINLALCVELMNPSLTRNRITA